MGIYQSVEQKKQEKKMVKQEKESRIKQLAFANKKKKVSSAITKIDNNIDYSNSSSQTNNRNKALNATKEAYERNLNNYEKKTI